MSEPAVTGIADDGVDAADRRGPDTSFVAGVVARISTDYDADADLVRGHAADIVRRLHAEARIQSFIPILVEKQLRELLRRPRLSVIDGAVAADAGNG